MRVWHEGAVSGYDCGRTETSAASAGDSDLGPGENGWCCRVVASCSSAWLAPNAKPPVAKTHGLRKIQVESLARKARDAHRNQAKRSNFRHKIDDHDFSVKTLFRFPPVTRSSRMIMFRGREQSRPEAGVRLLQRLARVGDSYCRIDARNWPQRPWFLRLRSAVRYGQRAACSYEAERVKKRRGRASERASKDQLISQSKMHRKSEGWI